ncbi:hypothetical protein P691DRAFT_691910 [Macrolepiota fuliginosa MF-IS2]|uniref:RRM domain-containing protein n=1 Tax=Macrolepiota fuliginosa MF-IS2 TaxID=1400762 RepID=A0A9P5XQ20_9AGAR|nr:hypothetical protein P691DRAFT_691910 [Macrolepiota fuliginosa MF-IS2]
MTTYPVQVSGIAPSTTEKQLKDFFAFCGGIDSIDYDEKSSTATVRFVKAPSVKTAVMLNGGTLEGATISVTSDAIKDDDLHPPATEGASAGIEQSDKPRAAIAAEYLAKGYTLSEQILERAIDIDRKQGISSRFLQYFHQFDEGLGKRAFGPEQKVTATVQAKVDERIKHAKAIGEEKGYSKIAHDYYEKAISSPLGKKVLSFYTETSKQVHDIHEEALRIAYAEKARSMMPSATAAGSESASSATAEKAIQ